MEAASALACTSLRDFIRRKVLDAPEADILERRIVTIPAKDWGAFEAWAKTTCVSGSPAEPGQLVAVPAPTAPRMPVRFPSIGGVNGELPTRYRFSTSSACARSSGVKSMTSSGIRRKLRP